MNYYLKTIFVFKELALRFCKSILNISFKKSIKSLMVTLSFLIILFILISFFELFNIFSKFEKKFTMANDLKRFRFRLLYNHLFSILN